MANCCAGTGREKNCSLKLACKDTHQNTAYKVISEETGSEFADSGPINILQTTKETSIKVAPVAPQSGQVVVLNEQLQLFNDLINLGGNKMYYILLFLLILPGSNLCKRYKMFRNARIFVI